MSTTPGKLSEHLLSVDPKSYSNAVEHPFLRSIADGSAPVDSLSLWLSQDRIYAAHAYPRFIAYMIAHIPFSPDDDITSERELANQSLLRTLSFCIQNVVDEAKFFINTAKKYNLDLDCWKQRDETEAYADTMLRFASKEDSMNECLVFLWAMEKVYLDAWTFIGRVIEETGHKDSSVQAVAKEFVQHWTNADFQKFVQELADLVDNLGIQPGSEVGKQYERIWDTVLLLEEGFWPRIGEDQLASAKK